MKIKSEILSQLENNIIKQELEVAKRNKQNETEEIEGYVDLLDSVREPKQYEWMSDIRIPEFISHILTQASIDANQYFQTRDFVEVYLEDKSDEAMACSEACKEIINRTLNQKHLFHYFKYMRARTLNQIVGRVYARCWWEQKFRDKVTGYNITQEKSELDVDGNPLVDEMNQTPQMNEVKTPVTEKVAVIDRFNYDIIDPRNIFMDNKYVYSLQQKDWIFVRSEKTIEDLELEAEEMNYFGLEEVEEEIAPQPESDTALETYNKGSRTVKYERENNPVNKYYDIYERFGKYWCIIKDTDDTGYPTVIEPGIDENGKVKKKAELIETIITYLVKDSTNKLIRFDPAPNRDANGESYRPLLRGLCYIHPLDDVGMGDGKHTRELQLALDDTFNISNDRVMLATLPTFKTKKFSAEDSSEIYIEPGHNIPLENPREDLEMLEISDNIEGAVQQGQFIRNMMQQVDAIYPNTMGDVGMASTTATAVAGSEQRSNMRSSYKALTFENTFLTELYWMTLQMTWQYARPETGTKLAGDKIYNFDPTKDYFYKPVTASIESEYSKANKIKEYNQILGYLVNLQHPDTVKLLNYVLGKMFEYMGDEFANFGDKMLNPQTPVQQGDMQNQMPQQTQPMPPSNQNGVPMSGQETMTRGM